MRHRIVPFIGLILCSKSSYTYSPIQEISREGAETQVRKKNTYIRTADKTQSFAPYQPLGVGTQLAVSLCGSAPLREKYFDCCIIVVGIDR